MNASMQLSEDCADYRRCSEVIALAVAASRHAAARRRRPRAAIAPPTHCPLPPLRKWRLIHSGYALTIPGRCVFRQVGGSDLAGGAEGVTDRLARRAV